MPIEFIRGDTPEAIFFKLITLSYKKTHIRKLPESIEHYLLLLLLHFFAVGKSLRLPQDEALALLLAEQAGLKEPRERLVEIHTIARLGLFTTGLFPGFRDGEVPERYYHDIAQSAYLSAEEIMQTNKHLYGLGPPFGTVEYVGTLELLLRSMRGSMHVEHVEQTDLLESVLDGVTHKASIILQ